MGETLNPLFASSNRCAVGCNAGNGWRGRIGDEAAEKSVDVLYRLDQAERAATSVVDGDVLET
jgi:hypothetical protein